MNHFVYLLSTRGRKPLLKIGQTWNINVRLQDIARLEKKKITLLGVCLHPSRDSALEMERQILNKFHKYRLNNRTEWFKKNNEMLEFFSERFQKPTGRVHFG